MRTRAVSLCWIQHACAVTLAPLPGALQQAKLLGCVWGNQAVSLRKEGYPRQVSPSLVSILSLCPFLLCPALEAQQRDKAPASPSPTTIARR